MKKKKKPGRSRMVYKASNETYDFRRFKTIHVFVNEIRNNIINMSMANDEQDQFLRYINKLKGKTKPQVKKNKRTGLKILTPKQILQRLPIALAQIKAGNNSESLLNEIRQIVPHIEIIC